MEKYKDSDVELMSILLKLQEQTSPIRMSIGYTVGGTVRQGIILYEAAPKVIETLIEKGYTCDLNGCGMRVYKKDLFVIDRKSGINTIAEVNSSWGIKNPFFFQKKVFYWGTKEEQKEIYVLEEGETILSLNKYGDLWEAETIAIPWIHHSQEVEVQHSKYSGIVTVEKTIVRSDDTGAVHMYIYFAGGEKDV